MSTAARLSAFALAVVLAFGGAYAVGAAVGPIDDPPAAPTTVEPTTGPSHPSDHGAGG